MSGQAMVARGITCLLFSLFIFGCRDSSTPEAGTPLATVTDPASSDQTEQGRVTTRPAPSAAERARLVHDLTRAQVDQAKRGLVFILTPEGSGSGFVIRRAGSAAYVVTNAHVLQAAKRLYSDDPNATYDTVETVFFSGTAQMVRRTGVVISKHRASDLAVVFVDPCPPEVVPFTVATTYHVFEGMPVVVFGFPYGHRLDQQRSPAPSVNRANISKLGYSNYNELTVLTIDQQLNPGNSGGPLINAVGEVVGVAVATVMGEPISFAISADTLQGFLDGTYDNLVIDEKQSGAIALNGSASVTAEVSLADPFFRLEEIGLQRLEKAPTRAQLRAPFQALGSTVATSPVRPDQPIHWVVEKPGAWLTPVWYQVWVRRKGVPEPVYYAPFVPGIENDLDDAIFASMISPSGEKREPDAETKGLRPIPADLQSAFVIEGPDWSSPLKKKESQRALTSPGFITTIRAAEQGRVLVVALEQTAVLGVLDLQTASWRGFIPISERASFAAGGRRLVVHDAEASALRVYDLRSLAQIGTHSLAGQYPVVALGMGSANARRLSLLHDTGKEERAHMTLIDLEDFTSYELNEGPLRHRFEPRSYALLMDPLGRFFTVHDRENADWYLKTYDGYNVNAFYFQSAGSVPTITRHGVLVGPDKIVFGGHVAFEAREIRAAMDPFSGCYLLIDYREGISPPPMSGMAVYDAAGRKVAYLPDVYHATGSGQVNPRVRRFFFNSTAGLLVYLGENHEAFYFLSLDYEVLARAQHESYLFLLERLGGVVQLGRPFQQRIKLLSSSDTTSYAITSGPPGLKVDQEGLLSWDNPVYSGLAQGHQAQLVVENREKVRQEYTFYIQVLP